MYAQSFKVKEKKMKNYRKVGNIICDPDCEEAKALLGKMVAYGDDFRTMQLTPKSYNIDIFEDIDKNDRKYPFVVKANSWQMICAVEEAPELQEYRPYTLEEAVRLIGRVFRPKHVNSNDGITYDSVGYVSKTSEGDLIINNIAVEDFMEMYEWYDPETGKTEPIGVEVEE